LGIEPVLLVNYIHHSKQSHHNSTMSMITAASWVPRGFAAPLPTKYELDESELKRIEELAKLRLEDATDDLEEAQANAGVEGSVKGEAKAKPSGGGSKSKSKAK
jgi:periodic tryptophan protein 1